MDANDDIPPVLHIWWRANALYPALAASARLRLAEVAIRQILDDELVVLIRNRAYPTNMGEVVPRDEYDSVLRRWDTWSAPDEGVVLYYRRPDGVDYIPIPPPLG
jgi:hypothetical protein